MICLPSEDLDQVDKFDKEDILAVSYFLTPNANRKSFNSFNQCNVL